MTDLATSPCQSAGHEKVLHVHDEASGLRAIIAVHSTSLGPAAGGCRLWTYSSSEAALVDALRLSEGMSYKNALAGLALGGGKAVILGPVEPDKREAVFEAFGRAVEGLGGRYVTAEDVGVSVADMEVVATQTRFVSGLPARHGAVGGDPSPFTARGVRLGIEAAVEAALGRPQIDGLRIAIQGLGHVGSHLARELAERGAKLVVADVDKARVETACDLYGAEIAPVEEILMSDVDVLAPCALGGAITEQTARQLRARIVAGAANNQLATPLAGKLLFERGITYAPDYVINAGGIIMVAAEYLGEEDLDAVNLAVSRIRGRTADLLRRARHENRPPDQVALTLAREIVSSAK